MAFLGQRSEDIVRMREQTQPRGQLTGNFGNQQGIEGVLARALGAFLEQNPEAAAQARDLDFSRLTELAEQYGESGSGTFDRLKALILERNAEGLGSELFDRLNQPEQPQPARRDRPASAIGSFGAARRISENDENLFSRGFRAPLLTRTGIRPSQ